MKNKQNENTEHDDCTTLSTIEDTEDSLMDILLEWDSMTKQEIKLKIQELHTKHLNSMNKYEMWHITREIMYLKIALGQLKKCRKQNWNELKGRGMQYDGGFMFKSGTIYPFGVDLNIEEDRLEVLIEEFIAELSPYLNEAEQMLFKFALCEEIFDSDDIDEN
jgi:hypothetical protein